jgi:hypothetical protein
MVFRVRLCDPELDQHLAVPHRSCSRVTDDARECTQVGFRLTIISYINLILIIVFICVSISGNVIIETKFFDDDLLVSTSKVILI